MESSLNVKEELEEEVATEFQPIDNISDYLKVEIKETDSTVLKDSEVLSSIEVCDPSILSVSSDLQPDRSILANYIAASNANQMALSKELAAIDIDNDAGGRYRKIRPKLYKLVITPQASSSVDSDAKDTESDTKGAKQKRSPKPRAPPKPRPPSRVRHCSFCKYKTTKQDKLVEHTRMHTGEKPFGCTVCDFASAYRHHLKAHMYTHSTEKPFECEVCKLTFSRKSYLFNHQKVHSGVKKWKCDECDFSSIRKESLDTHSSKHTGIRPFQCPLCPTTFVRKQNMTKHVKAHAGVKPHLCDVCGAAFAVKGNLTAHKKIHTRERNRVLPNAL